MIARESGKFESVFDSTSDFVRGVIVIHAADEIEGLQAAKL